MVSSVEPKVQVTVRLPAAVVRRMDELVAEGVVASRAAFLERAAELDRRREQAQREAVILLAHEGRAEDDLAGLARWAQQNARGVWADLL